MKMCRLVVNFKNVILILTFLISNNCCRGFTNIMSIVGYPTIISDLTRSFISDIFPLSNTIQYLDTYLDIPLYEIYKNVSSNEDIFLPVTGLLQKYGYRAEEHEVQTSDGYILTMIRIPSNGPVVFLMHGGMSSSDDFVTLGPKNALAYVLADAGYDVWLGNARGNKHSKRHVTLSPASAAFWDYSLDEIGRYDLAAMIDYALDKSNKTQLKIIGHSLGTTAAFVLCSEKPEYNEKISMMIMLSSVTAIGRTSAPILRLFTGPLSRNMFAFFKFLRIHSLFTWTEILKTLTIVLCGTPELALNYCNNLLFAIMGNNYDQINMASLPVVFSHFPAGGSMKLAEHASQLIRTSIFRRFDYGEETNILKYGSRQPPDYNLQSITTKVILVHSDNDWICVEEDFQTLLSKLPNTTEIYKVPHPKFSHVDFLFAKDVKTLLYDKLLDFLDFN